MSATQFNEEISMSNYESSGATVHRGKVLVLQKQEKQLEALHWTSLALTHLMEGLTAEKPSSAEPSPAQLFTRTESVEVKMVTVLPSYVLSFTTPL